MEKTQELPQQSVAVDHKHLFQLIGVKVSPREFEVLKLLAQGYSNPNIAKELGIKSTTVKLHVKHIFEQNNFRRRGQTYGLAELLGVRRGTSPMSVSSLVAMCRDVRSEMDEMTLLQLRTAISSVTNGVLDLHG